MMSDMFFRAPDDENSNILPVPFEYKYRPEWLFDRTVQVRWQYLQVIDKIMENIDAEGAQLFEKESWRLGSLIIPYNEDNLHYLIELLKNTIIYIEQLPYELWKKYNEVYKLKNIGYIKLLQSLQAIFKESLRLQKAYQAWGE
jgi:hypothetical protein